jgi:ketosteroid isomerase-like protein
MSEGPNGAREVVEAWYAALQAGNVENVVAGLHPELQASVVGSTPVSGRFDGRDAFIAGTLQAVFAKLDPGRSRFAQTWRIFAADGNRVVGMMSGDAMARNGRPYDGVYCQLFTIRDNLIAEYVEFVDTVLVEAALFDNPLQREEAMSRPQLALS